MDILSSTHLWEPASLEFSKTYHVNGSAPNASDAGPGTPAQPFRTINHAAQVLQAGERVVIAGGVYRESVHPARGGAGPQTMISYEAAEGDQVVIKGSVILSEGWRASAGWALRSDAQASIWQISLEDVPFGGYNPFGMDNVIQDRFYFWPKRLRSTKPFFQRRGMVFVDGLPLQQVDLYRELAEESGRFWIEHNGLTLHMRLPGDSAPEDHCVEITTKEQVFAPKRRGLGYIRVKGITFEHAASGFPVPQRGLVSAYRGHHWIVEGNTIRWANSVGLDLGNECWNASSPEDPAIIGHHIVRGNMVQHCGICGMAGIPAPDYLVEDNLIEHCCFHDAENSYESAGAKFHNAERMLFRHNIVRHIAHGNGLWLDYTNVDSRVTGNIFADIATIGGGIHIEASHAPNFVDHNLVFNVRAAPGLEDQGVIGGHGVFSQGCDHTVIAHNLIVDCEMAGVFSELVPDRLVAGRGGTARNLKVLHNIFHRCGQAAIEFANQHNFADGNLYGDLPGGPLRILFPEPQQWLDIEAGREFYGWEQHGAYGTIRAELDADTLELTQTLGDSEPQVIRINMSDTGFWERLGNQTVE